MSHATGSSPKHFSRAMNSSFISWNETIRGCPCCSKGKLVNYTASVKCWKGTPGSSWLSPFISFLRVLDGNVQGGAREFIADRCGILHPDNRRILWMKREIDPTGEIPAIEQEIHCRQLMNLVGVSGYMRGWESYQVVNSHHSREPNFLILSCHFSIDTMPS